MSGPVERLVREPAVHFAVVGALLFAAASWRSPAVAEREGPRVVVPASQVAAAKSELESRLRRSLTPEEEDEARQMAVDREILLHHALELGLDRQPEIARRLAQIASFVAEDTSAPPPNVDETAWWAAEAKRLGLDRGDRVVRSLLIDRSRRLIRAAVLLHEPSEEALEAHLREFPEAFAAPAEFAIDVAFLGRGISGSLASERLQEALSGKEPTFESWPALPRRDLERRLGSAAVMELGARSDEGTGSLGHRSLGHRSLGHRSLGQWQGPFPSLEGPCLLRLRDVEPPRTPALERVRAQVRARTRQHLADQWLEERLEQLRQLYGVDVEDGVATPGRVS